MLSRYRILARAADDVYDAERLRPSDGSSRAGRTDLEIGGTGAAVIRKGMATRGKCSLTLVFRNGNKTDLAIAESGLLDADTAWSSGPPPPKLSKQSAASIGIQSKAAKRIGMKLRLTAGTDTLAVSASMDPSTNTVSLDPAPADGPAGPGKLRVSWALIDDEEPAFQIWQGDLVMG